MAKNTKVNTSTVTLAQQQLISALDAQVQDNPVELSAATAESILDILFWAKERLDKQRENSKIYQKKSSLMNKLMREQMSKDELEEIDRQVRESLEE